MTVQQPGASSAGSKVEERQDGSVVLLKEAGFVWLRLSLAVASPDLSRRFDEPHSSPAVPGLVPSQHSSLCYRRPGNRVCFCLGPSDALAVSISATFPESFRPPLQRV